MFSWPGNPVQQEGAPHFVNKKTKGRVWEPCLPVLFPATSQLWLLP